MKKSSGKNVLSLKQPIVHMTWAPYNYLLSIGQHEIGFYEWFLNVMINVVGIHGDEESIPFLRYIFSPDPSSSYAHNNVWDTCPFIKKLTINRGILEKSYKNVIEFIIEMIDEGYYLYLYLYQGYTNMHISHQNLIFGYDMDNETIYLADHFYNGKYSMIQVSFNDIINAYEQTNKNISEYEVDRVEYIYLIKSQKADYSFNLNMVINQLTDYIASKNSFGILSDIHDVNKLKYNDTYYYGISMSNLLCKYLMYIINNPSNEIKDHRPITFFHESKEILDLFVQLLFKNKFILDESKLKTSKRIKHIAHETEFLFLKYTLTKDVSILGKIIECINLLNNEENIFIMGLLGELKSHI
jgi:hypothetical protein